MVSVLLSWMYWNLCTCDFDTISSQLWIRLAPEIRLSENRSPPWEAEQEGGQGCAGSRGWCCLLWVRPLWGSAGGHTALRQAGLGWSAACFSTRRCRAKQHPSACFSALMQPGTLPCLCRWQRGQPQRTGLPLLTFLHLTLPISAYLCQYVEHSSCAWLAWCNVATWRHGSMGCVFVEEKFPPLWIREGLDKDQRFSLQHLGGTR